MRIQTVYLIRHCKAEGQAPEAGLTAEGRAQADKLAGFLKYFPIDYAVSSPFIRAGQSLLPFAEAAGITVQTDSRLAERILSAKPLKDWQACLERTFTDADLCYPGGESSRAAANRAETAVNGLLAQGFSSYAVATHGNLMSLLLKRYDERIGYSEWKNLSNPDVYRLTFSNGVFQQMERIWNG